MQLGSRDYPGLYTYPGTYDGIVANPDEFDTDFYVGPLGGLRALPSTAAKVETPLSLIGGTHTSLTGAYTRDVFGYKRSWSFDFPGLTRTEAVYVEALQRNLVPGPLYLIDPRRPNRLPEQIASGGSLLRTPDGFIGSNTTITTWSPMTATATTITSLPAAPLLRGTLAWQLLAPGAATLELAGLAPDGRHNVPVMPRENLTASAWAVGPPSDQIDMTITVYGAGGDVLSAVTQSTGGFGTSAFGTSAFGGGSSLTTLSPTDWTELAVDVTTPPGAAYLRLALTVPGGTGTGTIYVTALQVASAGAAIVPYLHKFCDYPDYGGGWSLGGGAPQVVADAGSSNYLLPGLQTMALTLTER